MRAGGGEVVSQMWTSALKKYYSYHICEIYTYNLAVCLYIKCSFCLYPIENVWNAMEWHHFEYCLHSNVFYVIFKQNDQFFLPFSVNCSQVAMFQIMPALCPHGQGEGVVNQMWTGLDRGRGVAKIPKFVRTSFMDDPTAKRSKLKLDSIILFFFDVLYEEATTGGVL